MKKTLAIIALVATSFASFGQGYFLFTGGTRGIWTTNANLATGYNVSFLYGTGVPAIATLAGATGMSNAVNGGIYTPTNSITAQTTFNNANAWTAILGDSSYHLATNSGTGNLVVQASAANGSWSYNGSPANSFGVSGTGVQTYNVYVIGWSSAYATPWDAQTAGSAVGWSDYFSYAAVNSIGTAPTMVGSGLLPFGVVGAAAPVPEPSTMALAGLGALSLLAFRRRK